jgi:hypothetical protein
MAKKATVVNVSPGLLIVLGALYHAATLVADAKSVKANLRRFQANPTWGNLARVVLAEGVFVEDFGLPA